MKYPGAQGVQLVDPFIADTVPTSHALQVLLDSPMVPARHGLHAVRPLCRPTYPSAHGKHATASTVALKNATGHKMHCNTLDALTICPGWHWA